MEEDGSADVYGVRWNGKSFHNVLPVPRANEGVEGVVHVRKPVLNVRELIVLQQGTLTVRSKRGEPEYSVARVVWSQADGQLVPHQVPHFPSTLANGIPELVGNLANSVRLMQRQEHLLTQHSLLEPLKSFLDVHGSKALAHESRRDGAASKALDGRR